MLIGASILAVIAVMIARGAVNPETPIKLENAALFWHLVDIIWIFIFPLYYLMH